LRERQARSGVVEQGDVDAKYLTMLRDRVYQHKSTIRDAWRTFDENHDGVVTSSQLVTGLERYNLHTNKSAADGLIRTFNRNSGTNKVSYSEFVDGMQTSDRTGDYDHFRHGPSVKVGTDLGTLMPPHKTQVEVDVTRQTASPQNLTSTLDSRDSLRQAWANRTAERRSKIRATWRGTT